MTSRFFDVLSALVLFVALLTIAGCASTTTSTPAKSAEVVPDETTRTTLAKGKFESPPEIQPSSMSRMVATETGTNQAAQESMSTSPANGSRISSKEKQVNVRSVPSTKGGILTVLKSGQAIQVLETRDSWARISWQQGVTARTGWIKKVFLEGY